MDPDSNRLPPPRRWRPGEHGRSLGGGLRVNVSDGASRPVRDGGLARWLRAVAPSRVRGEVAVALATDAHVRRLNRRYRRKDVPTDVLSFPGSADRDTGDAGLGDIVIATGVAKRQAAEAGHSYQTELRVLALHGLLHLLGYDHDDEHDAGRMARAEARLRRKGGLPAGLIARSRGAEAQPKRRRRA